MSDQNQTNVLAIDTCNNILTVALQAHGRRHYRQVVGLRHSVTLQPTIDELMSEAGCFISDIDVFAATRGPGSYTGIRIGLTTITTLAYTQAKKAIGISSLELLVKNSEYHVESELQLPNFKDGDLALACIDARGDRLFASFWQKNGYSWQRVTEDRQFVDQQLNETSMGIQRQLLTPQSRLWLIGDGQEVAEKLLTSTDYFDIKLYPHTDLKADSLIDLALDLTPEDYPATANYCARTQAERLKKQV